jgi:ArsR family transcriptional regulator
MEITKVFKAFSSDIRMKIFEFLLEGKMCVSGIVSKLNVTQPAVTQHLKILRQVGLIKSEKIGYWMHYSIDESGLSKIKKGLTDFVNDLNVKETKCKVPSSKCPARKK